MAKPRIGLIDYDMGNLRSVSRALENVGGRVEWIDRPSPLKHCDAVVLPGVGAFSVAVKNLKARKLFNPIQRWIKDGRPFLGICLGYQLLFDESEEGKPVTGLKIFDGKVRRIPAREGIKIPHIGWNQTSQSAALENGIFKNIPDRSYFYFVHSYIPAPKNRKIIATTTEYGTSFASSVCEGRIFACQFHPEKSGKSGLKLLSNFVRGLH